MDAAPRKGLSPDLAVRYAVRHLQDAEVDLLVAVRTGRHRRNSVLLAALVLTREALAMLSKTATHHTSRRKAKTPHLPSAPGARFL
jgi:hypothetical protein